MKLSKTLVSLLMFVLVITSLPNSNMRVQAEGYSEIITFEESEESTRSKNITIPANYEVERISVNNGNVDFLVDGNILTVTVTNGNPKTIQTGGEHIPAHTKFVTNQPSASYSDGDGYRGTLERYVHSGGYTPADSRTETHICYNNYTSVYAHNPWRLIEKRGETPCPSQINYNSGGYSGVLKKGPGGGGNTSGQYSCGSGLTCIDASFWVSYSGTVTKPASDTRVYRYQGDVTRPATDTRKYKDVYSYEVTVHYSLPMQYGDTTGEGLQFDGISNYVEIENRDYLKNLKSFSVALWVKPDDLAPNENKAMLSNTENSGFSIYLTTDGRTIVYFRNSNTNSYVSPTFPSSLLSKDKWNQIAFTYDGSTVRLYLNGELKDSRASGALVPPVLNTIIGGEPAANGVRNQLFKGKVKSLQMWNRVISAQDLLNSKDDPNNTNTTGLIGKWDLEPYTTSTVFDKSPNKNHGMVKGSYEKPNFKLENVGRSVIISSNYENVTHNIKRDNREIYVGNQLPYDDKPDVGTNTYTYHISSLNGESITNTKSIFVEYKLNLNQQDGLSFNGKEQYASIPNTLDSSKPFTMQANVMFNEINTPNNMHMVSNLNATGGVTFSYRTSNNTIAFLHANGVSGPSANSTSIKVEPFKWYRLTGVYTGNEVKLYINGVLQQTTPLTMKPSNIDLPFFLGGRSTAEGLDEPFKGRIEQVSFWNRVLSENEIKEDKHLTGNENGLAGYWVLDHITTGKVFDKSIHKNHGNVIGYQTALTLHAKNINDMGMELNWNAINGATGYELKRDDKTIYDGIKLSTIEDLLVSDTDYRYQIVAKNNNGITAPAKAVFKTKVGSLELLNIPNSLALSPVTLNGETQKSYGTFTNKLIIKDTRKVRSGWKLQAKANPLQGIKTSLQSPVQVKQVSGKVESSPTIHDVQVVSDDTFVTLVEAGSNVGYGIYEITFPEDAVEFTISPSAYANEYQGNITWLLE